MGRYYEGDIEGKFWFGCQSSDDGEFFGAVQEEPQFVEYVIYAKELDAVHLGIQQCKENLKGYSHIFNKAYEGTLDEDPGWVKLNETKQKELYVWFARLDMGMRILIHFINNPKEDCLFTAEF
jgi:hypothetical protein